MNSYFLDVGLIGMLRNIDYLSVITSKDVYEFIKSEYKTNLHWQNEKLFTLKTFYEWLRIGKAHHDDDNINSKYSLLYQEVHRLKNSLRQETQAILFKQKLDSLNTTQIFQVACLYPKSNLKELKLAKSKTSTPKNGSILQMVLQNQTK